MITHFMNTGIPNSFMVTRRCHEVDAFAGFLFSATQCMLSHCHLLASMLESMADTR